MRAAGGQKSILYLLRHVGALRVLDVEVAGGGVTDFGVGGERFLGVGAVRFGLPFGLRFGCRSFCGWDVKGFEVQIEGQIPLRIHPRLPVMLRSSVTRRGHTANLELIIGDNGHVEQTAIPLFRH